MGALSAGSKAAILGCIFLQLAMFSSSERVFGVHRLLQYDKAKTPLGSRRGSINLPATVDPNADLSKRVLIIQHEDVTDELITRMTSQTQRLGGVVVVLPEDMTSVGHDEIERWKGFEARLLNAEINYAIYFAFGNDQLRELQRELGHSSDGYHIQTQGAEPTKIASVAAFNIQVRERHEPNLAVGWVRRRGNDERAGRMGISVCAGGARAFVCVWLSSCVRDCLCMCTCM
jgi:hypothetical protein